MNSHSDKPSAGESILTTVAESIGATLGTIAAKAGAVQKALVRPSRNRRSKPSSNSQTRKNSRSKHAGTKRGVSRRAAARPSARRRSKAQRKRPRATR